jgi:putative Holliday junction resolvase
LSDPLRVTARPLPPVPADRGQGRLLEQLSAVIDAHQVSEVVVGLPRNMDGTEGQAAASARRLAERLKAYRPDIRVNLHDERLTTALASRVLIQADISRARRREIIDGQAAVVLLSSYLSYSPGGDRGIAAGSARIGVNEVPNEEREDIVILTDDEGNEVEFLFLDAFEVSGRKYAVLVPLEGTDDEDEGSEGSDEDYVEGSEAMIFRLERDEDGDEVFVEIEDDDEWAEVTAAWEDLQDEDFVDADEDGGEDEDEEDGEGDEERPNDSRPS